MSSTRRRPTLGAQTRTFRIIASVKRFVKLCLPGSDFPTLRAFSFGLIIGIGVTFFGIKSSPPPSEPYVVNDPLSKLASIPRSEIIDEDILAQGRNLNNRFGKKDNPRLKYGPTFAFVFSTGRCGTKHLSLALRAPRQSLPRTYITHEEEHLTIATRTIVSHEYRRMASLSNETVFNTSMYRYIEKTKLPFFKTLLVRQNARHLVYTGHVPTAFGVLPSLINILPIGSVRLLRMRRDRIVTALSLMALGAKEEDPWGSNPKRWFPIPMDAHVRLKVSPNVWNKLNRFQKWLWYIDDVECRWQSLLLNARHLFSFAEVNLDDLHVLDGGIAWKQIATFLGTDIDLSIALSRQNSIQQKNRTKDTIPEDLVRQWDMQYRGVVGPCELSKDVSFNWPSR